MLPKKGHMEHPRPPDLSVNDDWNLGLSRVRFCNFFNILPHFETFYLNYVFLIIFEIHVWSWKNYLISPGPKTLQQSKLFVDCGAVYSDALVQYPGLLRETQGNCITLMFIIGRSYRRYHSVKVQCFVSFQGGCYRIDSFSIFVKQTKRNYSKMQIYFCTFVYLKKIKFYE